MDAGVKTPDLTLSRAWDEAVTNTTENGILRTRRTSREDIAIGVLSAAAITSNRVYESKAALFLDLTPSARTPALVVGDPIPGNDGLYMKVGAANTGSWNQRTDFIPGAQFVRATNSGAGASENYIIATSGLAVVNSGYGVLIALNIIATNTGPTFLAMNGELYKPLLSSSGATLAPGSLKAGMAVLVMFDGTNYRIQHEFPIQVVRLTDAGAGTANALVATATPFDTTAYGAVLVLNVFEVNTGPATLAINGGTARPIVTNSGNALASGYLTAGMSAMMQFDGTNYRLLSDVASSAIQAAAEAAKVAAEAARDAAIAAVPNLFPLTMAAMKALNTTSSFNAYLVEDGKAGNFKRVLAADYTALIAADTAEALIAVSTHNATYAWLRVDGGWAIRGIDVRWAGVKVGPTATRTVAVANSAGLQAVANLQNALFPGLPGRLPAGTIEVALSQTISQLGYSASPCAVKPKTGTCFIGAGMLASVIKLRDGESALTSYNWNVMAVNTGIENVRLEHFLFDINGQNNLVSPNRSRYFTGSTVFNASPGLIQTSAAHGLSVGDTVRFWRTNAGQVFAAPMAEYTVYFVQAVVNSTQFRIASTSGGAALNIPTSITNVEVECIGTWNHFNCAALLVRDPAENNAKAYINRGKFMHLGVINGPGVTSLGLSGQSIPGTPSTYSYDIEVAHCWFNNNGIDTIDHSSVYLACNGGRVHHCFFDHPTPSTGVAGPLVACELHGSDNQFTDNYVNNYAQGTWICAEINGPVKANIVSRNTMLVTWLGHGTWTIPPLDEGLSDVEIVGEVITVDATRLRHPNLIGKVGISINNTAGEVRRVTARGNKIVCLDREANTGIVVSNGASSGDQYDTDLLDNTLSGFASGITVNGLSHPVNGLRINGNNITDVTPSRQFPANNTRGITVVGVHGVTEVTGNKVSGAPGNVQFGILMGEGAVTHGLASLAMSGNVFQSAVIEISDIASVTGKRTGAQALSKFTSPPAEATWEVGDFVPRKGRTLDGSAPNRYIIQGWTRMVAGSAAGANTLGTHWAERRELLGV